MDVRVNHRDNTDEHILKTDDQRSHLIQRAGAAGSGLFPGWGPKV